MKLVVCITACTQQVNLANSDSCSVFGKAGLGESHVILRGGFSSFSKLFEHIEFKIFFVSLGLS